MEKGAVFEADGSISVNSRNQNRDNLIGVSRYHPFIRFQLQPYCRSCGLQFIAAYLFFIVYTYHFNTARHIGQEP